MFFWSLFKADFWWHVASNPSRPGPFSIGPEALARSLYPGENGETMEFELENWTNITQVIRVQRGHILYIILYIPTFGSCYMLWPWLSCLHQWPLTCAPMSPHLDPFQAWIPKNCCWRLSTPRSVGSCRDFPRPCCGIARPGPVNVAHFKMLRSGGWISHVYQV